MASRRAGEACHLQESGREGGNEQLEGPLCAPQRTKKAELPVSLLLRADRARLLRVAVPEQVPEQTA